MLLLMLFCGGFVFVASVLFILDTVVWKIEAGAEFLLFGINYANFRHRFYFWELAIGAAGVLLGIVLIVVFLCAIKKCRCCGKYMLKKQNFCCNCGEEVI